MNKHEKPKTHKIGRVVLTGLTALTIAGIGAGVACIVTAGGNSQEHVTTKTSTTQTSSSQDVTENSSKEPEITKKTPGVPDYTKFDSDPIQFFRDLFNDYTYDDSYPGYLPNVEKTITNVAFTKFAAATFSRQYHNNYADWLTDPSITEPYELYDTLCEHATCQWEGNIGFKQGGYEPVDGDIIVFSDIKDFDNEDPTHYVSCVAYGGGWNVVMVNSLVTKVCYGESSHILGDIYKKLGTNYQYVSIFTIDQGSANQSNDDQEEEYDNDEDLEQVEREENLEHIDEYNGN